MKTFLLGLGLLLAGCATSTTNCQLPPVSLADCPPSVPIPRGLPSKKPTPVQIADLEIRVELAREAERRRGDACAQAVHSVVAPAS